MLVNRAAEKGIDKKDQRKGELLAKLNKVKLEKSSQGMGAYEEQPTVLKQKLRIDFELYFAANMPNDKSGN